tara:strand:- start:2070 stop:2978 length:909 start_codon:yes stop_codon:yes gene_type:complete
MSKIIIDEIEAKTTDLALTPNGTGNVEVQSELVDGTLQLNTSTQLNNVKIKSPPDSAGQNHTLILPDNDVDVDKYLKVKSVTGSGSTAVGQLEYATIADVDTNNLNASNFTSGTLPSARLPATLPASSGFGLKLIQKITVSSNVSTINFTNLDNDANFKIIGKNVVRNTTAWTEIAFLSTSTATLSNGKAEIHERLGNYAESYYHQSHSSYNGNNFNYFRVSGYESRQAMFIAELSTDYYNPAMHYRQWHDHYDQANFGGACEMYMSMTTTNVSIAGISFKNHNSAVFQSPTEIMLYQYIDS